MRKFSILLFVLMAFAFVQTSVAATAPSGSQLSAAPLLVQEGLTELPPLTVQEIMTLSNREISAHIGRKLTLRERIGITVAKRKLRKAAKKGTLGGAKSQLVALLLVVLVGGLGIHRFYLGYTTIGIIQLLTFGGLGIWTLIDLIRIVLGDLGPADGSAYDPAL